MQRITKLFLVPVFVLGLFSCTSALVQLEPEALVTKSVVEEDATSTPHLNPYSLRVMQAACDSLMNMQSRIFSPDNPEPPLILEATDYYIRFDITDSTNYAALIEMDMDLFDYPLDEDLPSDFTPDSTWAYAVVKPSELYNRPLDHVITTNSVNGNFSVAQMSDNHNLTCQILDACYIPPDFNIPQNPNDSFEPFALSAEQPTEDDALPFSSYDLEMMAHQIAGYEMPMGRAISNIYPSGRATLECTAGGQVVPLTNTKIQVRHIVKIADCFTNDEGYYYCEKGFTHSPSVLIRLRTRANAAVHRGRNFITPECYNYGKCNSNAAYNLRVLKSYDEWKYVATCCAVTEYYKQCIADGVGLPPNNLKVWCWGTDWSGTPMLRRFFDQHYYSVIGFIERLLEFNIPFLNINPLYLFSPDVIVGMNSPGTNNYTGVKALVFHELSHASHFATVGLPYWARFIAYISSSSLFDVNCYGSGNDHTSGEELCCVGEAWGFANKLLVNPNEGLGYWFDPEIRTLYNIINDGVLTRAQLFNALRARVDSMDELYAVLSSQYPMAEERIRKEFSANSVFEEQTRVVLRNNTNNTLNVDMIFENGSYSVSIQPYSQATVFGMRMLVDTIEDLTYYLNGAPYEITITASDASGNVREIFYNIENECETDFNDSFFSINNWDITTDNSHRGNTLKTFKYTITNERIN